jgi:hypothetical protein
VTKTLHVILAVAQLFGCEHAPDEPRIVLDWNDPESKAVFHVTEGPGTVVKQNSRLHVQRDGRADAVLIDDDAIFSTVAFVRYEHWLLVVCRGPDEVWAGYDYDAAKLYGEGDWSMLPFTRWSDQGDVVAERKLREESASPANFPRQTGGPG